MKQTFTREIKGYESYSISVTGKVFSRGIPMKIRVNSSGYGYVFLFKRNKRKMHLIHRLVAGAFIPNPHNLPEVNHLDGNKKNCCLKNLKWSSKSENQSHAFLFGLNNTSGSKNGNSKFSDSQIDEIRKWYESEEVTLRDLAAVYNVHNSTIFKIVNCLSY